MRWFGCWTAPTPSVCAEERRGWRIRARDCLSAAGASSSETPPAPSTAGCPVAKRRGRRQQGRLLLPSFLGETRKEGAPPGAHPGTRLNKSTAVTIKTIATSACQISARAQNASKYPGQPKRSNLRDSEPAQPRNRLAQRLVLLGETEAHHALVEAVAIEGR
ncbi:MAG TPA: hypothetical protein DCW87_03240 [Comamonadaceae bacterium]|nr:hypothetical protein [Comamonadaceae bacterium]